MSKLLKGIRTPPFTKATKGITTLPKPLLSATSPSVQRLISSSWGILYLALKAAIHSSELTNSEILLSALKN